jgi:DedD protein
MKAASDAAHRRALTRHTGMARSLSDEELQLKKRARRRLVGAIVLVSVVAVVLPMVLDSEPRPVTQNVEIQIPSPNAAPSGPKGATAPAAMQKSVEPAANDMAPGITGAASGKADGSASNVAAASSQASASVRPGDVSVQPKPEARADSSPSGAKSDTKTAASKPAAEQKPEPAVKADSKSVAAKPDAKPDAKAVAPAANATPDAKHDAGAKADARTSAVQAKGPAASYVVQLAALADAARAKQLQQQVSTAGVKGYTEVIHTAKGPVTRVRAGPFPTKEAAEKARDRLKGAGLDGKVVPK